MRNTNKVIITCAVTGSIHTPSMSPYLPITPDEIAEQAIAAAEAGATLLHLHARDPKTGMPKQDPEIYSQFLSRIKQSTDAIINITTGGGIGMSLAERLAPALAAKPEVASLNMGSMNFCAFQLADKFEWRHDWEKPYLEATYGAIYSNTYEQIEQIMRQLGMGCGTKFEYECYDSSHLYTLKYFADLGLVKPPFFIQFVFGVQGGMGADYENLMHMRALADKLFDSDYYLSVLAVGRAQMKFLTMSMILGGNVRVGLEDNLYLEKGKLAESNAIMVKKISSIAAVLGLEIAKPDEAREMLALKGSDRVAF